MVRTNSKNGVNIACCVICVVVLILVIVVIARQEQKCTPCEGFSDVVARGGPRVGITEGQSGARPGTEAGAVAKLLTPGSHLLNYGQGQTVARAGPQAGVTGMSGLSQKDNVITELIKNYYGTVQNIQAFYPNNPRVKELVRGLKGIYPTKRELVHKINTLPLTITFPFARQHMRHVARQALVNSIETHWENELIQL